MEITYLAFLFDMEPLISHWLPSPRVFLQPGSACLLPPSLCILIRDAQIFREEREEGIWAVPPERAIQGWKGRIRV